MVEVLTKSPDEILNIVERLYGLARSSTFAVHGEWPITRNEKAVDLLVLRAACNFLRANGRRVE